MRAPTQVVPGWVSAVAVLVGCSASSASRTAGLADAASVDAGHDAGNAGDAKSGVDAVVAPDKDASDARPASGLLALTRCLGLEHPLTFSGQSPYVDVPVGHASGEFLIDFGSTFSSIDFTAFAAPGPTSSGCDPSDLGETCTVAGFAFFGPATDAYLVSEDFSGGSGLRQAGIVGTDFLSEQFFVLDYTGHRAFAASSASRCSDDALAAAGFVPLSASGFYENDLSRLKPATAVDSAASADDSVPNVPTVPVIVAGVTALAQLDTGFDDDVTRHSVNVNRAFYEAIVAAQPAALVRDASLDASLSTCVDGVDETVEAYRLASGVTFGFVASEGDPAGPYADAVLFVKHTPSAAQSCGGIGTWTVPGAQVGASFYVSQGALAFDPFAARVWVPSR